MMDSIESGAPFISLQCVACKRPIYVVIFNNVPDPDTTTLHVYHDLENEGCEVCLAALNKIIEDDIGADLIALWDFGAEQ